MLHARMAEEPKDRRSARKMLSLGAMRRLPPTLAAFAVACGARVGNSMSSQLQQDAGGASQDTGVAAQQAVNTPEAGAEASTAPPRSICDGSDAIRLAYWVGGGGPTPAFTSVLYELGYDFLYVDGHCHYWVADPTASAGPYHEGVLTAGQESTLHDLVSYDDFARSGPPCPGGNGVFDAGTEVLWDGVVAHSCYAGWKVAASWPMRTELFAAGTLMTAAMRVEVGQDSTTTNQAPSSPTIYPWPLVAPAASYEVPASKQWTPGQSVLIRDPSSTAALRHLRDQAIAEATAAGSSLGLIRVQPMDVIGIRDDLPFTRRSDGLWSPP
jgi:hypothetical protein